MRMKAKMKITIEIEDSDISELLYDRIESYGVEISDKDFDKFFEENKEKLRNILRNAIEDTIDTTVGGDEFESFIEEKGLVD